MSSKFLFGVLLPAILILGLAIVLKQSFIRTAQRTIPAVTAPAPAPKPIVNIPPPSPFPAVTTPAPAPAPMTDEERQEAIDKEKDRLSDLQTSTDSQALSNILADLYSPEKEIREAAIDAAEQVHNTNAIPVLRSIAMTNQDQEEQSALLDAANFIATPEGDIQGGKPPMSPAAIQAAQQRQAQAQAQRQARQQGGQGQIPNGPSVTPSQQTPPQ